MQRRRSAWRRERVSQPKKAKKLRPGSIPSFLFGSSHALVKSSRADFLIVSVAVVLGADIIMMQTTHSNRLPTRL
jgi:hypothetical protein